MIGAGGEVDRRQRGGLARLKVEGRIGLPLKAAIAAEEGDLAGIVEEDQAGERLAGAKIAVAVAAGGGAGRSRVLLTGVIVVGRDAELQPPRDPHPIFGG